MFNGLYVVKGTTIIGEASVSNIGHNKTQLGHLSLSHMSEKGLRELSKQVRYR